MIRNLTPYLSIQLYKLRPWMAEVMTELNFTRKEIASMKKLKKIDLIGYINKNIPSDKLVDISHFVKYENKAVTGSQSNLIQKHTGIKKLTKDDIANFEHQESLTPFKGKINSNNEIINLNEHQKKFLMGFLMSNQRSAIAFWGVGTGKTFLAVSSANLYLNLYPKNKIIIVTPSSIFFNIIHSMIAYGLNPQDPRYTFMTVDKFYRNRKLDCSNSLIIIDEAHNYRSEIEITNYKGDDQIVRQTVNSNKKRL